MAQQNNGIIHVIDENGNKCTISLAEPLSEEYRIDEDWYLANGCSEADKVITEVIKVSRVYQHTVNGDFDEFEQLPYKPKAQLMNPWTSGIWQKYRYV